MKIKIQEEKNGGKIITLVHLLDRVPRPTRGFATEGARSETVGEAVRQEEGAGSGRDEVPRKNRRFREERVRGRSRTQRNGKEKQTEVIDQKRLKKFIFEFFEILWSLQATKSNLER